MNSKLFSRDFALVVIGQIISLFGNAIIRFALPLYLLNQTGSSALFGTVTALAFIPSILLAPVGGIIADRINKRSIMVTLDFLTAVIIAVFALLLGTVDFIALITVTLMLLYGIAGAYQPSVSASIPALVDSSHYVQANSVINTITSFASLIGPILGGMLYSFYGLMPLLWISAACFFLSAVMEIFIHMPHIKQASGGSMWQIVKSDFRESFHFIRRDKPVIIKVLLVICGINLFLSAMISVAAPYLITEVLDFEPALSNRLFGLSEGSFALGGLAGGISAGLFAKKLTLPKAGNLLIASALMIYPMALGLMLVSSPWINYFIITGSFFCLMIFSTLFSVQMLAFVQGETPQHLIGKVLSVIMTLSTCAQPLGTSLYGLFFDFCSGREYIVIFFAATASLLIAISTRRIFKGLSTASSATASTAAEN